MAIGLLMACRQHGVVVPDHLSVVGFDDIEAAQYVSPPLTTVSQPRLKLGQLAMKMTLDLLGKEDVHDLVLACELVVRKSSQSL